MIFATRYISTPGFAGVYVSTVLWCRLFSLDRCRYRWRRRHPSKVPPPLCFPRHCRSVPAFPPSDSIIIESGVERLAIGIVPVLEGVRRNAGSPGELASTRRLTQVNSGCLAEDTASGETLRKCLHNPVFKGISSSQSLSSQSMQLNAT